MKHRTRLERAEQLGVAAIQLAQGQPLRQVAAQLGVARSTLRDWCAAAPPDGLPAEVAACLATPAGVGWLHRLVCEFLELSGLSAVVGASYDRQYALTVQVQDAVAQQAQA